MKIFYISLCACLAILAAVQHNYGLALLNAVCSAIILAGYVYEKKYPIGGKR